MVLCNVLEPYSSEADKLKPQPLFSSPAGEEASFLAHNGLPVPWRVRQLACSEWVYCNSRPVRLVVVAVMVGKTGLGPILSITHVLLRFKKGSVPQMGRILRTLISKGKRQCRFVEAAWW